MYMYAHLLKHAWQVCSNLSDQPFLSGSPGNPVMGGQGLHCPQPQSVTMGDHLGRHLTNYFLTTREGERKRQSMYKYRYMYVICIHVYMYMHACVCVYTMSRSNLKYMYMCMYIKAAHTCTTCSFFSLAQNVLFH